jgi:hypothetical protein
MVRGDDDADGSRAVNDRPPSYMTRRLEDGRIIGDRRNRARNPDPVPRRR